MTIFSHDWETYSEVDLRTAGASKYARHPSTVPLMLAYAFDNGPIAQWVPEEGEPMPWEVRDAMRDDTVTKSAFNSGFEWAIWTHTLGIETPHTAWRDSMVNGLVLAFPGSLDAMGAAMGLREDARKDSSGSRLIGLFSTPRTCERGAPKRRLMPHEKPDEWERFKHYNRQDVLAERSIMHETAHYDLPDHEWALWQIDRDINERGIPVNRNLVYRALALREAAFDMRIEEMRRLTGLANPNSPTQLLPWLRRYGYPFEDLKKGHVSRALDSVTDPSNFPEYKRVLEIRQEISRISSKKFEAFADRVDDDGRVRQALQFGAAGRTWRWGGRGVQFQNMPRPDKAFSGVEIEKRDNWRGKAIKVVTGGTFIRAVEDIQTLALEQLLAKYDKPFDLLASTTRGAVQPSPGHIFIVYDLNAIENRVLGWLADEPKIQAVFRDGRCPYMDFATDLYGMTYQQVAAEYKAGDKEKRTNAKPAVLGCGYLLGKGYEYEDPRTGAIEATGLLGYARGMGIDISADLSERSVSTWRERHPMVRQFWSDIERCAMMTVQTGFATSLKHIGFEMRGEYLRMNLPSGRALSYYRPEVKPMMKPWGEERNTLTYMGKDHKGQWVRLSTHPGKLTENADQAIARDILAEAIRRIMAHRLPIILHVHDEIVVEIPEALLENAWNVIHTCMVEVPKWAPGLILDADGFATHYYLKD